MKRRILSAAAVALVSGHTLQTDYTQEHALRIETETVISMETTSFEMERDGEPMNFGGGGGMGSEEVMHSVELDTVLAHVDGKPTRVRRVFEELSSTSEMTFRDQTRESESDCPLNGVTLELSVDDDGDTVVDVIDGDEPDDDVVLERHRAALALDALLPEEAVAVGDTWELSPKAIRRALGSDVRRGLYPRPEREDSEREEGGRGRGSGRRGPGGGGGSGSLFAIAEWEGEATLVSDDDEYEGQTCAVIEVKLSAGGDMPEPEWGGGGRGRGRMPATPEGFATMTSRAPLESEYEIEIEGRVYYSIEESRPLGAEFEGTMAIDQRTERSRGDSTMTMSTSREGTYERTVTIESVVLDEEDE